MSDASMSEPEPQSPRAADGLDQVRADLRTGLARARETVERAEELLIMCNRIREETHERTEDVEEKGSSGRDDAERPERARDDPAR
jgi:hypothetical protein